MILDMEDENPVFPYPLFNIQFGRRHNIFDYFFPTQYFYSFEKSKIYIKAKLIEGNFSKSFYLYIKNCYSNKPNALKIPIEKTISFYLKEGEKECISDNPIECRFPIPDVYYFDIIYSMSFKYDEGIIPPVFYHISDEKITSNEKFNSDREDFRLKKRELIIVQDYFSYQVTKLTKWLIILTGVLIVLTGVLLLK